jgi:hypothetical protein
VQVCVDGVRHDPDQEAVGPLPPPAEHRLQSYREQQERNAGLRDLAAGQIVGGQWTARMCGGEPHGGLLVSGALGLTDRGSMVDRLAGTQEISTDPPGLRSDSPWAATQP